MPLDASILEHDLLSIVADYPQSVTIARGRRRYSAHCAADSAGGGMVLVGDALGRESSATVSIHVPVAEADFAPAIGDVATVAGVAYRVASVSRVPGDPCYTILAEA